jgi:hypothetical protein
MNSVPSRYFGKENNIVSGKKETQDILSFPLVTHPHAMQFSEVLSVSDIGTLDINDSVEVFNINTVSTPI